MFLKEVIINGFKSFGERTHVQLHRGVTAVVGPNGCGKSNIVDAIRWVLGEQSAKALRGNKMQDVIFDGTEKRKPLSLCEVSLVFSDCEAELGTAFNEVEIKRRVSRDGHGDYFLNGKACRLRDIQSLFMDTGIGRESYSFMAQGQISQIIDTNPSGRRVLFEEAAGITKYKSQRKEALNKLERVDQNLQRVSDKLEMLTKQIASVKRQASKTLRFKRLEHRLRHLDLAYNGQQYGCLKTETLHLEQAIKNLRQSVEQMQLALSEKEGALAKSKQERIAVSGELQASQERVYELKSAKEQAESRVEFSKTRHADLQQRINELKDEVEALKEQLGQLDTKATSSEEQRREHEALMSESEGQFNERTEQLQYTQSMLGEKEVSIRDSKQDLLVQESAITRLRSNTTSLEVDLKTSETRDEGLKEQLGQLVSDRDQRKEELSKLEQKITLTKNEQGKIGSEEEGVRETIQSLRSEFKAKQVEIQDTDREVAKLTAHLDLLENMQSRFEGFGDGAKAILKGTLSDVVSNDQLLPLTKCLEIEDDYVVRVERLLGIAAEAISLNVVDSAVGVSEALLDKKLGRAALHVAVGEAKVDANVPDFLTSASSVVKVKASLTQFPLNSLFSGCYFCSDLNTFLDFWKKNPSFDFLLVVTERLELIDCRGIIYAGHRRKQGRESSLIQRESEIRKTKDEARSKNDFLTELNEQSQILQDKLTGAEEDAEKKHAEFVELGQIVSSLTAEERSLRQSIDQNDLAIKRIDEELGRHQKEREDARARLEKSGIELENALTKISKHREFIESEEAALEGLRQERDSKQEKLNNIRIDRAEKMRHLEMITQGLDSIQEQRVDLQRRIKRRAQEIDTIFEQLAELEKESGDEGEKAKALEETLKVTTESLQKHHDSLKAVEGLILEAESGLGDERNAVRGKESALHEHDVSLTQKKSQLSFIFEKVQSEYGLELSDIDWKQELWVADELFETRLKIDELEDGEDTDSPKVKEDRGDPTEEDLTSMDETDWAEIEGEIKTLKSRIAAMGGINPNAIEEYSELKEQYDFLKVQSDDLWNSKEELLKAIDEINETSRQMFEDTFNQVRKNFQHCFKRLNGGVADLRLLDSDDVLESGIEIMAQPVGTKLKTLSLLSGGQKTMTAVSLLFSIYMVKPSPFCVLDELDAPLDDVNIGRFTDMLKGFLEYSQFLVITHNKRTLHVANSLYGVTMQEPGVTRLVSLRFSKDGTPDYAEAKDQGVTVA